jgi:hypothetical protein
MALLHLMYDSLFGETFRKMFFKVHIVHIDESAVYDWSPEQTATNIGVIIAACERYGFEYTIIPIENVFAITHINPNTKEHSSASSEEYKNVVIESLPEGRE